MLEDTILWTATLFMRALQPHHRPPNRFLVGSPMTLGDMRQSFSFLMASNYSLSLDRCSAELNEHVDEEPLVAFGAS